MSDIIINTGFGVRSKENFRLFFIDLKNKTEIKITLDEQDILIEVPLLEHKNRSLKNIQKLWKIIRDFNEYKRQNLRIENTGRGDKMYDITTDSEQKMITLNKMVIKDEYHHEVLEKYLKMWLIKQSPEILKH